jgi:hypothetical protein
MLLLRGIGLLLMLAIGVCAGLGLLTRRPYFFRWAWSLCRYGLVLAVVVLIVFILERLLVPVL